MGYCTWWLTIALCFSALAASQGNETPEAQVVPFDDSKAKEPPMITVFDDEEVEGDDDKDITEDDEGEMKLLSRDFMGTNPKEVKGLPVFERDMLLMQRLQVGPTSSSTTKLNTTATTTTRGSMPNCPLKKNNRGYYWTSPDFGVQNYPNNLMCEIMGSSLVGSGMLTIKLHRFKLESGTNGKCNTDKLKTTLLNNRTRTLCGEKFGAVIRSPSFNFYSSFTTNKKITEAGFGMFITGTRTPCHQVITAAGGETSKISPPKDQNYCEYRIVAPTGRQVQIDYVNSKLPRSEGCKKDFILLNGKSEKMYPLVTSKIICGKKKMFYPCNSTKGEMYVAYKRTTGNKIGFVLKYTIV